MVAGGPYPTSCHGEIEGVDHFVLGEAESSFPKFFSDYRNGDPLHIYQCDQRPALSAAPIPRFDLLRLDLYDSVPLQFSRVCPFDCEFCDIVHLFGRKPGTKEPEQFIAELDAAYATGSGGAVFVVDDNSIGNKRAAKSLLRIRDWRFRPRWWVC